MCTDTLLKDKRVVASGQYKDIVNKEQKWFKKPIRIYAKSSTIDGKPKSFHTISEGKEWTRNYKPEYSESRKYYNISELESLCVSQFYKGKRSIAEIHNTHCLFADIDGNGDANRILASCDMIGLPREWLTIINTSQERLHVLIPLKIGLRKNQESFFRLLQMQFNEFLRACDCITDEGVIFDRLRMLSNPEAKNARNYKYSNAPWKRVLQKGNEKATGSALYNIFKSYGWGKKQNKTKKKNIPLARSIEVTREYIQKRVSIECTQKELSERLSIPYRTIELVLKILKENKEVKWQKIGNNKGGNKRRSIIHSLSISTLSSEAHKRNLLKDTGEKGNKYIKNRGLVLEEYNGRKVKIGKRNKFIFAATLELIHFRNFERDKDRIRIYLSNSYDIEGIGHSFSEKEILQCINSAMNPKYIRPVCRENLSSSEWNLLPSQIERESVLANVNRAILCRPNAICFRSRDIREISRIDSLPEIYKK